MSNNEKIMELTEIIIHNDISYQKMMDIKDEKIMELTEIIKDNDMSYQKMMYNKDEKINELTEIINHKDNMTEKLDKKIDIMYKILDKKIDKMSEIHVNNFNMLSEKIDNLIVSIGTNDTKQKIVETEIDNLKKTRKCYDAMLMIGGTVAALISNIGFHHLTK